MSIWFSWFPRVDAYRDYDSPMLLWFCYEIVTFRLDWELIIEAPGIWFCWANCYCGPAKDSPCLILMYSLILIFGCLWIFFLHFSYLFLNFLMIFGSELNSMRLMTLMSSSSLMIFLRTSHFNTAVPSSILSSRIYSAFFWLACVSCWFPELLPMCINPIC